MKNRELEKHAWFPLVARAIALAPRLVSASRSASLMTNINRASNIGTAAEVVRPRKMKNPYMLDLPKEASIYSTLAQSATKGFGKLKSLKAFDNTRVVDAAKAPSINQSFKYRSANKALRDNNVGFIDRKLQMTQARFKDFRSNPKDYLKQHLKSIKNDLHYYQDEKGILKHRSAGGKAVQYGTTVGIPAYLTAKELKENPNQKGKVLIKNVISGGISGLGTGFGTGMAFGTAGDYVGRKISRFKPKTPEQIMNDKIDKAVDYVPEIS